MIEERMSNAEMARLCPGVTAKTELVLVASPTTGTEAIWERDGKDWVRLQGEVESAVPDDSGTAPLSGVTPLEGDGQRDDGLDRRGEATGNLTELPDDHQI